MVVSLTAIVARGIVGFLQFNVTPVQPVQMDDVVDIAPYANINVCDDSGPLLDDDSNVREDCTREGCGFRDEVCYFDDYFERCLDRYGRPTGRCHAAKTTCTGVLGCLVLWFDCGGQYACHDKGVVGCNQASCSDDDE
jgi:hypothetical protein